MLTLTFYSFFLKLFHFWFVVGQFFNSPFPNLTYLSISIAELTAFFLVLRLIKNPTARFGIAFSCNLALGILIHGSYMYYRLFGIPLSFSLALFLGNIGSIGSSISALLMPFDLLLYSLDLIILVLLFIKPLKKRLARSDEFFSKLSSLKLIAVFIVFFSLWALTVEPKGSWKEPFYRQDVESMLTFSPIGYIAIESFVGIKQLMIPEKLDEASSQFVTKVLEKEKQHSESLNNNIPWKDGAIKPDKPNIFIIQVESLMAGFLGQKINGVDVLPNLTRLASEGIYLENFYSHALATSDSDFSTLTSLLPLEKKVAHLSCYKNYFNSLPKTLKACGFRTLYGNSAPENFWNAREMNTAFGFDEQIYKEQLGPGKIIGAWLSDKDFFHQIAGKIASVGKPVFGMFLTTSSHHPFNFKELPQIISSPDNDPLNVEKAQYANSINYADAAIGDFIKKLNDIGILSNSIVVIYGDHPMMLAYQGKELREKYGSLPSNEKLIRFLNSRVPCIIYSPGLLAPHINSKFCGQIDIAPTILSLCGIKKTDFFIGSSVFSDSPGFVTHKFFMGRTEKQLFWGRKWGKNGFKNVYSLQTLKKENALPEVDRAFDLGRLSELILEFDLEKQSNF